MDEKEAGFAARGGWWVVAQVPVLLGALLAPLAWGAASFDPRNAVQLAGAALTALGILLAIAGIARLGRSLTPFPRPLAQAPLLQSGAYRFVRHPIYAGLIAASLGWSLSWLSLPGMVFCAVVLLFFDRKSAFEEQFLRVRHPEYHGYMRRVRKLIPWVY
ncbi:MAG: isoprenylcysteine carboxylmethyltransferase family protein [Pseudomonadota bacterium]|nr:isoprenylcysteine carboxylmethyltransferase family protein [Pseudomonadota bacterium]